MRGAGWTVLCAGGGMLGWAAAAQGSGVAEPWDAPHYWTRFYPLALVASAVLGRIAGPAPWRWALVLIFAQLPVVLMAGGLGPLLPVGILLLALQSLPAMLVAEGARRLR